jgi:hypothetical protein
LQPLVSRNLPMRVGETMDFREPAAQLFLHCHDGGRGFVARRADALQQLQAGL